MSTIVVAKKNGMVAIGADTLTRYGYMRESAEYIANHSKICRVGTSLMAHVGHASGGLVLSSYFAETDPTPDFESPGSIFETARVAHKELKESYFLNPIEDEDDPFESSQFDILIANKHGIFGLYSLRSVQEYTKFYAFGSGSRFAIGAMHATYGSASSAKAIAKAGLEAACEFSEGSMFPIEIKTVKLKPR